MQQQPTILMVEDEILIRLSTAETLRGAGYRVIEAADGADGWALFESSPDLDLLVSDIRMPGPIDGLELARRVKASHPYLPVLLVSSHRPPEEAGTFDWFLEKPVSPSNLIRTVGELIGTEWKTSGKEQSAS